MSKRSEARDRRYFKAIKSIAEHTVRIALTDAKEQAAEMEDVSAEERRDYVESFFEDNFSNYKCDLIAVDLEDAYNDALDNAGVSA